MNRFRMEFKNKIKCKLTPEHIKHIQLKFSTIIIKKIIIIKLYAIIVCNIIWYFTQLYAINLIMIESHY